MGVWRFFFFGCLTVTFSTPSARSQEDTGIESTGQPVCLVRVNDEVLTEAMAIQALKRKMPKYAKADDQQLKIMCQSLAPAIVSEFIKHVLLKQEALKAGVVVPESEVDKVLSACERSLPDGLTLEEALGKKGLTLSAMREKIKEDLMIPMLLQTKFGEKFEPTDEELKTFYEENPKLFTVPETVSARHILLKFGPEMTDENKRGLREKMEGLRNRLIAGEDFAILAQTYSDCPSKALGGALKPFARGKMVKEFDDAAFGQKTGELGDIVETRFGYHLIEVTARDKGGLKPFDDVREKLSATLERRQRAQAMLAYLAELKKNADIEYFQSNVPVSPQP
ncbi:MAG: peptidylprolyl isomerase [Lentisphaeria bacterium]|nr:peptidylprolyl isomerase [Lentisphaeria bacterium]